MANAESPQELRAWVEDMKSSPRGPFEAIRWFCSDGSVLPPGPGACAAHGGGVQHGAWSERTRSLRAQGYLIANLLADYDVAAARLPPEGRAGPLEQLLVERYLVQADAGWIFRGAASYRGALQAEDEEAGARRLLLALAADPAWVSPPRDLVLREAVRLLPDELRTSTATIRDQASALAAQDTGFTPLRNKIHSLPEQSDADRVRRYAAGLPAGQQAPYRALAAEIDALHAVSPAGARLATLARGLDPDVASILTEVATLARENASAEILLEAAGTGAVALRDRVASLPKAKQRLAALEAGLILEQLAFTSDTRLATLEQASRRQRIQRLRALAGAVYGAGLLSRRQRDALWEEMDGLLSTASPTTQSYRRSLRYLARAPEWSQRRFELYFGAAMEQLAVIDPLALLFVQDRLRGSPLLAYGLLVDGLLEDADRLAGVRHTVFGRRTGASLRPLNPGLARGTLRILEPGADPDEIHADGIYVLPQTIAELPPVRGILTRGEGSSLSHVQLLARNLGLPNVVVREELMPLLEEHEGRTVVLAVSSEGVVELTLDDPRFEKVFGQQEAGEVLIHPDLAKLDLQEQRIPSLDSLRASDSGRIVGPKAANLGELRHLFGDAVPDGVAIPFGVFYGLLQRPVEPGGPSVFRWMRDQYAALRAQPAGKAREQALRAFLDRLRGWIMAAEIDSELREQLRTALERLGPVESYGLFVRSDTNVEDLPGFTGAGLNLTLPNVVGFESLLEALGRVWASPFTERAYGWRQAHMEQPEYVFPGVLLQRSFPSDKSGVLVTADVDTGDPAWLSVAVSEGVGGAVEGQAAEELRIHRENGRVRLLAEASSPTKAVLKAGGGLERVAASGSDTILEPDEIEQLLALAREIRARVPGFGGAAGLRVVADVEFAFSGGRLALLQIRPFVESRRARRSVYLLELGRSVQAAAGRPVDLDALPSSGAP